MWRIVFVVHKTNKVELYTERFSRKLCKSIRFYILRSYFGIEAIRHFVGLVQFSRHIRRSLYENYAKTNRPALMPLQFTNNVTPAPLIIIHMIKQRQLHTMCALNVICISWWCTEGLIDSVLVYMSCHNQLIRTLF